MRIIRLTAIGFKNLYIREFYPSETVNFFEGDNAQGKTNLIESIWYCTGAKSFRNGGDKDIVRFGADDFLLDLLYRDNDRVNEIKLRGEKLGGKKDLKIYVNGVETKRRFQLFRIFRCVVFTPDDLSISKGTAEERRNFIDLCTAQTRGNYDIVIRRFLEAQEQRNAQLKKIQQGEANASDLEMWNGEFAKYGSMVYKCRCTYVNMLNEEASKLYSQISGNKEKLVLKYNDAFFSGDDYKKTPMELCNIYNSMLKKFESDDIRLGYTSRGVQRDDMEITLNGRNVKLYASQGQHRSIALVVKLAQAKIMEKIYGEAPIVLLDDVMSELDPNRQMFILNEIKGMQVFITGCRCSIPPSSEMKLITLKDGRITGFNRKEKRELEMKRYYMFNRNNVKVKLGKNMYAKRINIKTGKEESLNFNPEGFKPKHYERSLYRGPTNVFDDKLREKQRLKKEQREQKEKEKLMKQKGLGK